jgi:hypothetical protein
MSQRRRPMLRLGNFLMGDRRRAPSGLSALRFGAVTPNASAPQSCFLRSYGSARLLRIA